MDGSNGHEIHTLYQTYFLRIAWLSLIATGDAINKVDVAMRVKFSMHLLRTFTKLHLVYLKITKMGVKNNEWSRRQHVQSYLNTHLYLYHVAVFFPFADILVIFLWPCFSMEVYTFELCEFCFYSEVKFGKLVLIKMFSLQFLYKFACLVIDYSMFYNNLYAF